jgi:CubicO group peptidase (beta-lactamase class C family)
VKRGRRHASTGLLPNLPAITGLLVIKNGKIVFEKYYLGADDKSLFTSMSVAKSFTSTLVGLAIADGKVANVDRPVCGELLIFPESAIRHTQPCGRR